MADQAQLDLIDELNKEVSEIDESLDTYILWANDQMVAADERVSELEVEVRELEIGQVEMRILGYAMAIAFIKDGIPWRRVHASMRDAYLNEARQTLEVIDSN